MSSTMKNGIKRLAISPPTDTLKLTLLRENFPNFSRPVTDILNCVPCITAKMKKAPIRRIDESNSTP